MELLAESAARLGISLSEAQLDRFEAYYQELVRGNRRVNLTRITDYTGVQVKHFLDSLTIHPAVGGLEPGWRVLDIGAGAGFPSMPLKLAFPEVEVTLMESTAKKTRFLEELRDRLEMPAVEVLTGRAESVAHQESQRESYDLVTARGLARLPVLLEYALPFCRVGGRLAAMKHGGSGLDQELAAAANALKVLAGRVTNVYPVELPGLTDNRVVVVVEKQAPTPETYPRRPGMPSKRPL